ncbi:MAG TPA: diacylglycerol kinase family lipid kinase [Chloroflexaceae bacterium]|nr:diacylglycerol kinase family lipid kinase [Chloroflexaceae bacterium]
MSYQHALVIMNPVSGQHDPGETRALIEERFARAGLRYAIRETGEAGDALRWAQGAAAEGFDLVVVSGGDGTVMEAMSGLIKSGSPVPLAQIPAGTANLLARALGIPAEQEGALETIFDGKALRLDVGYLPREDRYFALVAGAGYDARLIGDASRELKNLLGFGAYVVTGVKNLFTLRPARVELEVDGRRMRLRAHTVLIVNVGEINDANVALGPNIHPHDGKLDLMIMSSASLLGALRIALSILTRRFDGTRGLRYMTASRIRVSTRPALPTQLDGEQLGSTPLEVEAVPDGALLIVPPTYSSLKEPAAYAQGEAAGAGG